MSFSLRKQTWYLLSLLAVSLLTYSFETGQALDLRDNDEYWAYKIDIQDQMISDCHILTTEELEGCQLHRETGQLVNVACFRKDADGKMKTIAQLRVHDVENNCWTERDLVFLQNASVLIEDSSLEGFQKSLKSFFHWI
ncbi:MAG: hypothetical protein COV44_11625 [Deltaproteobacteria bacterium CG11_big_fil_rev_8_21_14_0_20_45_16]|nr:MAG: hypothetical protein COV44_11625 [Deltaproteobacteria bacterium CG11_big_fil_rev_8_21_14_0_20_45_16]